MLTLSRAFAFIIIAAVLTRRCSCRAALGESAVSVMCGFAVAAQVTNCHCRESLASQVCSVLAPPCTRPAFPARCSPPVSVVATPQCFQPQSRRCTATSNVKIFLSGAMPVLAASNACRASPSSAYSVMSGQSALPNPLSSSLYIVPMQVFKCIWVPARLHLRPASWSLFSFTCGRCSRSRSRIRVRRRPCRPLSAFAPLV
jgi:hypothetical protein